MLLETEIFLITPLLLPLPGPPAKEKLEMQKDNSKIEYNIFFIILFFFSVQSQSFDKVAWFSGFILSNNTASLLKKFVAS